MMKVLNEELIYEILAAVSEIPFGKVATYSQIARIINRDHNSRLVGKVLSISKYYGKYPCHRVVNHLGRLVPNWKEQRKLLEEERIKLKDNEHVDLKIYQWDYLAQKN